jgi:hypothetical protein
MSATQIIGRRTQNKIWINVIVIILILFIGLRPISGAFTDMIEYQWAFMYDFDSDMDPLIYWMARTIKSFGYSSTPWFFLITCFYFGGYWLACRRLSHNNSDILYLTLLTGFSTFSYGTNTIRNGMAMSFALLGISMVLFKQNGKGWKAIIPLGLAFITHKTCMLPLACFFLAYKKIDFRKALTLWLLAIIVSLVLGNSIANLFASIGFDDRLSYITTDNQSDQFSHTGFRWDFLLYSMMPIVLGYYVIVKRNVRDRIYSILISTYTLSNAFWVIVIRANFSDRFAYLSWFMYPIVIAYPLIALNIWGNRQGSIAARILFAHLCFTLFMTFIY